MLRLCPCDILRAHVPIFHTAMLLKGFKDPAPSPDHVIKISAPTWSRSQPPRAQVKMASCLRMTYQLLMDAQTSHEERTDRVACHGQSAAWTLQHHIVCKDRGGNGERASLPAPLLIHFVASDPPQVEERFDGLWAQDVVRRASHHLPHPVLRVVQ